MVPIPNSRPKYLLQAELLKLFMAFSFDSRWSSVLCSQGKRKFNFCVKCLHRYIDIELQNIYYKYCIQFNTMYSMKVKLKVEIIVQNVYTFIVLNFFCRTELMRRMKRYQIANYNCLVIKYANDTRYDKEALATHDK